MTARGLRPPPKAPYGGTAAAVPGTVQAANYDTGGQGVGLQRHRLPTAPPTATAPTGSTSRPPRTPRAPPAPAPTTSAGRRPGSGSTTPSTWPPPAPTRSRFRRRSPYGITDALHIANSAGTNLSGSVAVPNTGGYETWTTVDASVTLPAGQQTLTGRPGLQRLELPLHDLHPHLGRRRRRRRLGDQPFGGTPGRRCRARSRRRTTTPAGRASAYNVTAANGTANSYRSDGVDLEATADTQDTGRGRRAYDMGWTGAGQWFKYTVKVATAGSYTVELPGGRARTRSPTRCTSPTPPAPT